MATTTSPWRSRLARSTARTTAAAVGALTLAGVALVGGTAASGAPAGGAGAASATVATSQVGHPATRARQACFVTQLLRNGSFERPMVTSRGGSWDQFANNTRGLGWQSLDGSVEVWRTLGTPHTGRQHAEINSNGDRNIIWQAFRTVPRTRIAWSVALKARDYSPGPNWDTTAVRINGRTVRVQTVHDRGWTVVRGVYRVPRGQRITRFALQSLRHAGPASFGNLVDTASVRGLRCF